MKIKDSITVTKIRKSEISLFGFFFIALSHRLKYPDCFYSAGNHRCRSILGDDNPLEEIPGQHQRTHLCLILNRVSGLDIIAFGTFVADKVNLQLFTDAVALIVENDVFHDVAFLYPF